MNKILIVEDDQAIAEIERDYLTVNGYEADLAPDGNKGYEMSMTGEYDLILLDLMLPGMDGFTLCQKCREKLDIPILMVTARQEDVDKIKGLGLGADDYIEKPFSPSVLVARVKANLKQYRRLKGKDSSSAVVEVGDLTIHTTSHRVFVKGQEISLKNKEYELLLFLVYHLDQVFDKETLYEHVWGMDAMGDNATVAVHINRLRTKIEEDPAHPRHIQTVWGAGYRFCK